MNSPFKHYMSKPFRISLIIVLIAAAFSACKKDDTTPTVTYTIPPVVVQPTNSLYHKYNTTTWISSTKLIKLDTVQSALQLSNGTGCTYRNDTLTIVAASKSGTDTLALKLQLKLKAGLVGSYTLVYDRNAVEQLKNATISFFGKPSDLKYLNPISYNCGGTFTITSYDANNGLITGSYNFVQIFGIKNTSITGGTFKDLKINT